MEVQQVGRYHDSFVPRPMRDFFYYLNPSRHNHLAMDSKDNQYSSLRRSYSTRPYGILSRMKLKRTIVLSDIHFAAEDKDLIKLVFRFMKGWKPDVVILDGDIVDFTTVSKFPQHPTQNRSAEEDVSEALKFLRKLRAEHRGAEIIYVWGNHDVRLDKYLAENAPEAYPFFALPSILKFEELEIRPVISIHKENSFVYDDFHVGHYDKAVNKSGATAQALLNERGVSVIQGHVHKAAIVHKTLQDGTLLTGIENPCLAKCPPAYAPYVSWQQGFTIIESVDGVSFPQVVVVRKIGKTRGFVVNGKVFVV